MNWIPEPALHDLVAANTDAHRAASGSDGWIERYGSDWVLCLRNASQSLKLQKELAAWAHSHRLPLHRIWLRHVTRQPAMHSAAELLQGPIPDNPRLVNENGIHYHVSPEMGYSTGLFIDQRLNRKRLAEINPQKVLNCFAYTCSFSVVAAKVGTQTTSVDLSSAYLNDGRKNFIANQLNPKDHRFMVDDVRSVLPRLQRRQEFFDAIILDPPTFSRSKEKGVFRVERDLATLAESAWHCLRPAGWLLLSTNCRRLSREQFSNICENLNPQHHLTLPAPTDIPDADMPLTCWLQR